MKLGEFPHLFTAKDGREFILRTLREDELDSARRLSMQIFKEDKYHLPTMLEKYQNYKSLFIGCFDDKGIVGTIFGWPDPGILVVKAIAVVESYRI